MRLSRSRICFQKLHLSGTSASYPPNEFGYAGVGGADVLLGLEKQLVAGKPQLIRGRERRSVLHDAEGVGVVGGPGATGGNRIRRAITGQAQHPLPPRASTDLDPLIDAADPHHDRRLSACQ